MAIHLRTLVSGLKRPASIDAFDQDATMGAGLSHFFVRGAAESGVPELASMLHALPGIWCRGTFGLEPVVHASREAAHRAGGIASEVARTLDHATREVVLRTMSSVRTEKSGLGMVGDAAERPIDPILDGATYILVARDGRDTIVATALRQLREGGILFTDHRYRARLEHLREELRRDPNFLSERPHRLLWLEPWMRQMTRSWAAMVQSDLATIERLDGSGCKTLVVRYEELASTGSPSRVALAMCLGIDPASLPVLSPEPRIERESGVWRRFFTRENAGIFVEEAGSAMERLGYTGSNDWAEEVESVDPPAQAALVPALDSVSSPHDVSIELHADPPSLQGPDSTTPEHVITIDGVARRLFFICGHPRSGTTWTVAVLNQHPKIFVQGEFRFEALRGAYDQLTRWPWHVAHHEPVRSEAERAARESIRRIMGAIHVHKPGALALGDKTPRGLRVLIPGAPHVLLVRDGRDVLVSRTFHELSTNGGLLGDSLYDGRMLALQRAFLDDPELFQREPHRLLAEEHWVRMLARNWAAQIRHDLAVAEVIKARGKTPFYELRYERMRADTEGERARLYTFLGLDPTEASPLSAANRSAPGFERETPNAFYRKGVVGDWSNYFTPQTRQWFKEAAGEQLLALGYEKDGSW